MSGFRPLATDNERSIISIFVCFSFSRIFFAIIFDRDFWSDFRFSLICRSFIGIRRFKRLDLRLETLFLFNQLEQDFGTVKFDFSKRILFLSQFEFRCSVWFDSFRKPEFLSWTFWLILLIWVLPVLLCLIAYCMLVCLFAIEYPECEACYYESLGFTDHQQGK